MREYLDIIRHTIKNGELREGRTKEKYISTFGYNTSFNISNEILPVVTTKKIHLKSIIHELLWFISGSTNIKYLQDNGVTIWNEWVDEKGELKNGYGKQWRNFNGIDQFDLLMNNLKNDPKSRRHILTAWNPVDIPDSSLPPCHILAQFYINNNNALSCFLYQRSSDLFLGVPYNITSYSILTHLIAKTLNLKTDLFHYSIGDLHIYENHLEQCKIQLLRDCLPTPNIKINKKENIFQYKYTDIIIENYKSHGGLKGDVAV